MHGWRMADTPSKSPLASLLSSRKGVLTILVLVMATGLELVILYEAFRGKLTIDDAIKASFGTLFLAVLPVLATINGIAKEDAAAKTTGNIASTGDVTVNKGEVKS